MSRRVWAPIVWTFLILLALTFIWGNSLRNTTSSGAQSDRVVTAVRPVVDPQKKIPEPVFGQYVRKFAHLLEFALLGFLFAGLKSSVMRFPRWLAAVLPVLCACVDEGLQLLSDRSASIWDVLIDTVGILIGIGLFILCFHLIRKIRRKERTC